MVNEKRIGQQIATVQRILDEYKGGEPLARFLGKYYKANRQMGSKDRRTASRLTYHLFRLGRACSERTLQERLAFAEFLCETESDVVQLYLPELAGDLTAPLEDKISRLTKEYKFDLLDVFPFSRSFSPSIDKQAFLKNQFVQPNLFVRLQQKHKQYVIDYLSKKEIAFERLGENTLALANGTALDKLSLIRGKYEVQDYSSQETKHYFQAEDGGKWWDACAGSGGKSLLLMDNFPQVNLLVSDMRSTILRNLDERFDNAGIREYRRKIVDLTKPADVILGEELFDGIILDAPCSGSGTWGRSPEMVSAFKPGMIDYFATLQKTIAGHVIQHLKPGKPLVYITCSVFHEENERVVEFLQTEHGLKPERMEVLHGYRHRADTMFMARLVR